MQRAQKEKAAQLLLQRLPLYCHHLATFDQHEAAEAISPGFDHARSSMDMWTYLFSPFMLLAGCEKLYYAMKYLQHEHIREMLQTAEADLSMLRSELQRDNTTHHSQALSTKDQAKGTMQEMSNAEKEDASGETASTGSDVHGDATQAIGSAAEALTQLAEFVQVRLVLLDVYRCTVFSSSTHASYSVCETVDTIANRSKKAFNHPSLKALADLLQRELLVLQAVVRGLRRARRCRYEDVVIGLRELKPIANSWDGHGDGQDVPLRNKLNEALNSVISTLTTSLRRRRGSTSLSSGRSSRSADKDAPNTSKSRGPRIHFAEEKAGQGMDAGTDNRYEGGPKNEQVSYQCPLVLYSSAPESHALLDLVGTSSTSKISPELLAECSRNTSLETRSDDFVYSIL